MYGSMTYYGGHLLSVATLVHPKYRNIAFGHDLFEDTNATMSECSRAGFTLFEIGVIRLLTKKTDESYNHYIKRIRDAAGDMGEAARAVKCADLIVNIMNLHHVLNVSYSQASRLTHKYYRALCVLSGNEP